MKIPRRTLYTVVFLIIVVFPPPVNSGSTGRLIDLFAESTASGRGVIFFVALNTARAIAALYLADVRQ